ncbi:PilZ domain-containing protein [Sphingopyxis sp. JAI128]|uniref:PilZ domain-containing protein n=1 Tax=Sphingopyxis sp. JAI128 TaxID=2723066 RepID=UPI0016158F68|nr:PilZ domain-containing protein [Sphingopyxis sp. JAI128]MBB6427493.1 hypothetical protein [Sphingopyxis sp. JAI128]
MLGNRTLETTKAPASARRDERASIDGRARFREAGSNPFDAELFDLSANGFRMFTFSRQAIGKHIWVNLPGLQPVQAVVRRQDGNNYGCEFVNPLHASVADHLKAKLAK